MDPRIQADEFMDQLLAAHQAEDAFVPGPEDQGSDEAPVGKTPATDDRR